MSQEFLNKYFIRYRNSLLSYSSTFKISYEVREELVMDTIVSALDSFDHDRGSFESYCRSILKNKIINFKERNKDIFILISLDDYEEILPDHYESIEAKENVKSVVMFFKKLKSELRQDELQMFNEIYKICDNQNKINISKASENIGIAAETGWNIFKKIQRKASKLYKKLKKNNVELLFTLELPSSNIVMEEISLQKVSDYPKFQKADSSIDSFISKLSQDQIDKINTIYGEIPQLELATTKPHGFFKKLFSRSTK